ncbi:MAG: hypothetical protein ACJ76P_05420 [Actinomycetota bacterium]
MNARTLTRTAGVATIDLRGDELDASEASTLFDLLALPELERVVIQIDDRSSLGESGNVLLRGLEAHIGLHGVAVEVREGTGRNRLLTVDRS